MWYQIGNWAGVILLVGGSLWLVALADIKALGGASIMCQWTFCQWARRILIVLFVVLAAIQGSVATNFTDGHKALPHLIAALAFILAAMVLFLFDWWWQSRAQK